jgi:hypothetical protein
MTSFSSISSNNFSTIPKCPSIAKLAKNAFQACNCSLFA